MGVSLAERHRASLHDRVLAAVFCVDLFANHWLALGAAENLQTRHAGSIHFFVFDYLQGGKQSYAQAPESALILATTFLISKSRSSHQFVDQIR